MCNANGIANAFDLNVIGTPSNHYKDAQAHRSSLSILFEIFFDKFSTLHSSNRYIPEWFTNFHPKRWYNWFDMHYKDSEISRWGDMETEWYNDWNRSDHMAE